MVELKKELIRVEANSPPSTRPPITKHVAQSTLEVLEIASRLAALSATAILSACDYRCARHNRLRRVLRIWTRRRSHARWWGATIVRGKNRRRSQLGVENRAAW